MDLANLEFMQFHPTALYEERSNRRPLITEAMRGEGARLLDEKGRAFMLRHDKRGDLAPRDVVAQAMMEEMLHSGAPCLFLDVSGVKQDLPTRFPTVFEQCREAGLDIRKEPIPVVPAAHYFCGGVLTDTRGRTSMRGLYAIGECACTGLHGANRLGQHLIAGSPGLGGELREGSGAPRRKRRHAHGSGRRHSGLAARRRRTPRRSGPGGPGLGQHPQHHDDYVGISAHRRAPAPAFGGYARPCAPYP